jgi:hypothetical protein
VVGRGRALTSLLNRQEPPLYLASIFSCSNYQWHISVVNCNYAVNAPYWEYVSLLIFRMN